MHLHNLLKDCKDCPSPLNFVDVDITSISCDSRTTASGALFVALKGGTNNGNDFIDAAIQKGARVIVTELPVNAAQQKKGIQYLAVKDPGRFLRTVVERFYEAPGRNIKTIGVTGTNGKTTVTYLIESILNSAGYKSGVIGTIEHRIGKKVYPSHNTTPGFIDNQIFLHALVKEKIPYCIMEVSSHALDQNRVDGIDFKEAVFTNLTSDHLDYHKTTENYFNAKAKLFTGLKASSTAVINVDDKWGKKLCAMTKAKVLTYSINEKSDLQATEIQCTIDGTSFECVYKNKKISITTPLIGIHNVYNILGAFGCALAEDVTVKAITEGIANLQSVPGRLERVDCGQKFAIFIDYAHTEDGLEKVLENLKRIAKKKIILVFGCGGDRDKTKRPKMAEVASRLAQFSVITSDNPRTEEPQQIIDEIVNGFKGQHFMTLVDRKQAIFKALSLAERFDVVLIAGKGHETYQIFKDKTIPFDEREVIKEFFQCSPSKKS